MVSRTPAPSLVPGACSVPFMLSAAGHPRPAERRPPRCTRLCGAPATTQVHYCGTPTLAAGGSDGRLAIPAEHEPVLDGGDVPGHDRHGLALDGQRDAALRRDVERFGADR